MAYPTPSIPVPVPTPDVRDESPIKPLETRYAGCRFRSRLEARWAVFFDHLGIDWQYEPESFKIAGKGYLPDFYLPKMRVWAEVKGVLDQPTFDHLVQAVDPRGGLPASPEGETWVPGVATGRLLLLGPFPHVRGGWIHTRLDSVHGRPCVRTFVFRAMPSGVLDFPIGDGCPIYDGDGYCRFATEDDRALLLNGSASVLLNAEEAVLKAYRAARMARFEHGESGAPQEVHDGAAVPRQARRRKSAPPAPQAPLEAVELVDAGAPPAPLPVPVLTPRPRRTRPQKKAPLAG